MDLLTLALGFVVTTLFFLYFYLKRYHGTLEINPGLPILKPFLCFQSEPSLLTTGNFQTFWIEAFKKHGRTIGRYDGVMPMIVSIDPEFIKEITVKQFDNFTDVFSMDFAPHQTTLDVARGNVWKELRKMMSPTFTSGKLKTMLDPIGHVADNFLEMLGKRENEEEIDFKPIIQCFTFDAIAKVTFDLESKTINGENPHFLEKMRLVMKDFLFDNFASQFGFTLFNYFPALIEKAGFWPEPLVYFGKLTKEIIEERDRRDIRVGDFLDRLRDFKKTHLTPLITSDMIDAQGMIFMAAGYETTASTLGAILCHLAENPEVQERAYQEICDNVGDEEINVETIARLPYIEAIINESLRMASPATGHLRTCTNDTVVNGLIIKKGTRLLFPSVPSHFDPEFFPDPETYNPDRFMPENADQLKPFTFRPFGSGQRVCIGQRFAIWEMKIFLAKLLYKYQIVATKNTKLNYPEPNGYFIMFYPEMKAKIQKRS